MVNEWNYSIVARRESGARGVECCCLRQALLEGLGAALRAALSPTRQAAATAVNGRARSVVQKLKNC